MCVTDIRHQGQQRKKSAQDILALGDPRDGFNMERMPGEQRGHKCGRPDFTGQPQAQPKQQRGIGRIETGR